MACLLTSATCHLFGCCSAHVTALLWRFDYAGIAVLIVASFFPPVYYSFLCSPWTRLFYLVTTSMLGEQAGHSVSGSWGGTGPGLPLIPAAPICQNCLPLWCLPTPPLSPCLTLCCHRHPRHCPTKHQTLQG